jgi:hypothetical protein
MRPADVARDIGDDDAAEIEPFDAFLDSTVDARPPLRATAVFAGSIATERCNAGGAIVTGSSETVRASTRRGLWLSAGVDRIGCARHEGASSSPLAGFHAAPIPQVVAVAFMPRKATSSASA